MRFLIRASCRAVAVALILSCGAAHAAAGGVVLAPSPALGPSIAAFPHVVGGADKRVIRRINHALAVLDRRFKAIAATCNRHGAAERVVTVTLAGERYVSLVAQETTDCGAYLDTDTVPMVFDLKTGGMVDWTALLGPKLSLKAPAGRRSAAAAGMIGSKAMAELYWRSLPEDEGYCRDALQDDLQFQLWPDAKQGGIVMQPGNLFHRDKAACQLPAILPAATLRSQGVDAALLDEIDAAHARLSAAH